MESIERDEAADLIKRYGGKVTQSVSKKTSYFMGWDHGESKLSKVLYIVMHSSKQEKNEKALEHQHISCTFSLNFHNKSGVWLTEKILGKLATNLHK